MSRIALLFLLCFCLSLAPCAASAAPALDAPKPVKCKQVQVTDEQVDAVWVTIRLWECK